VGPFKVKYLVSATYSIKLTVYSGRVTRVGKLVALSMQWVTAVEDCEGKCAAVRWLACGLCSRMAQTTTRRFPAVSTGALVAA
jgi:hypothetical protein